MAFVGLYANIRYGWLSTSIIHFGKISAKKTREDQWNKIRRSHLFATLAIPGKIQLRYPSAIDWCWPTRLFIRSSSRACVCARIQINRLTYWSITNCQLDLEKLDISREMFTFFIRWRCCFSHFWEYAKQSYYNINTKSFYLAAVVSFTPCLGKIQFLFEF